MTSRAILKGWPLGCGQPISVVAPGLVNLTLAASSVLENTTAGNIIGGLLGKSASGTLSLVDDAGGRFALSGVNVVTGLVATNYEAATSHSITIRETDGVNTHDTTLTITVTNVFEQPTLASSLGLSITDFVIGVPTDFAITGATAGSAIAPTTSLPTGFMIDGAARTGHYDGTGSAATPNFQLTETLGDSSNSPRGSSIAIAINPALVALTLAASSIVENSTAGTVVGGVLGRKTGSTLSMFVTAGSRFAISGTNLVAGSVSTDYETATSHSITIREVLGSQTRDTTFTITVTNAFEQPTLASSLGLSPTNFTLGIAADFAITGATASSSIAPTTSLPTGFTINSAARTGHYDGTGSVGTPSIDLTETLADSSNSPHPSSIGVSIVSLPAPVIHQLSTPGSAPLTWYVDENAAYYPGQFWRVRRYSDAGKTTLTGEAIQQITVSDLAGNDIVFAALTATPVGEVYLTLEVGEDDGAGGYFWSSPSNTLHDTIVSVTYTQLVSTDGVNKSQYTLVDGTPKLHLAMTTHVGAACCVRTVNSFAIPSHFELRVNHIAGALLFGVIDPSEALGPAGPYFDVHAGAGSIKGACVTFDTGTGTNIYANGSNTTGSTPALAVGDFIIGECDPTLTNPTFKVWHKRGATKTLIANITMTTNKMSSFTPYFGAGTNNSPTDDYTPNFGASAWNEAPTSGYLGI